MLRISRDGAIHGSTCLRLEGDLAGPWVDETSRICEAIIANGERLQVDLAQVMFVDRAGVRLLAGLKERSAVLEHCSAFLKAQLHSAAK
jgi:ABC-type transporter Mla MlaB component